MTNEKAIYFLDKRKKELLEKQDSKEGFEFIKALAEIRSLEMAIKALEQQPTGHCKDCRWWKDSDGAYRRGVEAESICPINREEILKGEGYCFLYEPKMQEVEEDES